MFQSKKNNTQANIVSDEIVKTFESTQISSKDVVDNDAVETGVEESGNIVQTLEEKKAKKRTKKYKKKTVEKDEKEKEDEDDNEEDDEKTVTESNAKKFKAFFNFSGNDLTNSRFQDNSSFRVLKNWEDKPWNQT